MAVPPSPAMRLLAVRAARSCSSFRARRDPLPLVLLLAWGGFHVLAAVSGLYWQWHATRVVGEALAAVRPLQVMIDASRGPRACPDLFIAEGDRLDPAIRRAFVGNRPLNGNCPIQVDLAADHRSAADGRRMFLVQRNGAWHCVPPWNPGFPSLGSCRTRPADLLPPRS